MNRASPVIALVRAVRVEKILPLLLLMTCAALMRGAEVRWDWMALAAAFVMLVSVAGMKANVLTDQALDRRSKPQLYQWLTADRRLLKASLWAEGAGAAMLYAVAVIRCSLLFATALALYAAAFTLYSYNFLCFKDPVGTRLKVTWWGNLAAVCSGYVGLWLAGLSASVAGPPRVWWLGVAVGASFVDYSVFLNESASDADSERSAGLRTAAALLGARGAAAAGLGLLALGAAICVATLAAARLDLAPRAPLALVWLVSTELCASLIARARGGRWRSRAGLERAADLSFWGARVGMLAVLVVPAR